MKRLVPIEKVKYSLPKGVALVLYILLGILLVVCAGTLAYWLLARTTEGAFIQPAYRVAAAWVA